MTIRLLVSFCLPLVLGYLAASLSWRGKEGSRWPSMTALSMAVGLGMGISSFLFFLGLVFLKSSGTPYLVIDALLMIAGAVETGYALKRAPLPGAPDPVPRPLPPAYPV